MKLATYPIHHTPWHEPPVLFLHGLFGKARNMQRFQKALFPTYDSLAMDLRNHGQSPHGETNLIVMAEDVKETLQAHHIPPCIVVGHSLGGKIGMLLALLYPELVKGLVVADIPPAVTGHGMKPLAEKMYQTPFPERFSYQGLNERQAAEQWLHHISDVPRIQQLLMQNIDFSLKNPPKWSIGVAEIWHGIDTIQGWPDLPPDLSYPGPCLFIKGECSPYITEDHFPLIKKLFPTYQLTILKEAGHWLQVDNREGFIESIVSFLYAISNKPFPSS
ncbi:alpha/beta fold hydrolase [Entomobacter blattae]|uniref:Esterase YbfF n=1 Tax=Entomobacter blattae TaxID=2762277 RepID=A0A7H1NTA5_9PROT|nr:alpha/beta fold hydrolase [Entomobacter blattae]QNT79015.1 Esterase YbfF [Entomobacter blattae]